MAIELSGSMKHESNGPFGAAFSKVSVRKSEAKGCDGDQLYGE